MQQGGITANIILRKNFPRLEGLLTSGGWAASLRKCRGLSNSCKGGDPAEKARSSRNSHLLTICSRHACCEEVGRSVRLLTAQQTAVSLHLNATVCWAVLTSQTTDTPSGMSCSGKDAEFAHLYICEARKELHPLTKFSPSSHWK